MRARPILIGLAALVAVAQLVPVARTNPPVEDEVDAPPEARALLERACYDCHSHATRWPWYAWVAPASWLLAHEVREAREHMNFSTWGRYDAEERAEHLDEIAEVLEEGEMPPWFYLPLHAEARLTEAELATIHAWTGAGSGRRHADRDHDHHHDH
jgi:mono/diheme cytochrome c family protein